MKKIKRMKKRSKEGNEKKTGRDGRRMDKSLENKMCQKWGNNLRTLRRQLKTVCFKILSKSIRKTKYLQMFFILQ